jgi:hypothetical protein
MALNTIVLLCILGIATIGIGYRAKHEHNPHKYDSHGELLQKYNVLTQQHAAAVVKQDAAEIKRLSPQLNDMKAALMNRGLI